MCLCNLMRIFPCSRQDASTQIKSVELKSYVWEDVDSYVFCTVYRWYLKCQKKRKEVCALRERSVYEVKGRASGSLWEGYSHSTWFWGFVNTLRELFVTMPNQFEKLLSLHSTSVELERLNLARMRWKKRMEKTLNQDVGKKLFRRGSVYTGEVARMFYEALYTLVLNCEHRVSPFFIKSYTWIRWKQPVITFYWPNHPSFIRWVKRQRYKT